jgi:hypothetical protein
MTAKEQLEIYRKQLEQFQVSAAALRRKSSVDSYTQNQLLFIEQDVAIMRQIVNKMEGRSFQHVWA